MLEKFLITLYNKVVNFENNYFNENYDIEARETLI